MSARGIACLLVVCCGAAAAEPKRRGAGSQLSRAAGEEFALAVTAEKRGKLSDAVDHYKSSLEISPHANTMFNLAEVYVRLSRVHDAMASFEAYLALAPKASDRAEVEARILALARTPVKVEIQTLGQRCRTDLARAYVLVDGEIVSRPGARTAIKNGVLRLSVTHGTHWIDVVTALSYTSSEIDARAGTPWQARLCAPTRVDGNMVIQTTREIRVSLGDKEIERRGARVRFPPGSHRLSVRDREHECPPISVDAPADDEQVLYLHLAPADGASLRGPSRGPFRCRKLAIKRHTLTF